MASKKAKQLKKKVEKIMPGGRKESGKGKVVAAGIATAGVIGLGVAAVRGRSNGLTTYHVVPDDEGWAVTREGESKPIAVFSRKRSAVSAARTAAHDTEPSTLVIHGQDGKIQKTHSYETGSD